MRKRNGFSGVWIYLTSSLVLACSGGVRNGEGAGALGDGGESAVGGESAAAGASGTAGAPLGGAPLGGGCADEDGDPECGCESSDIIDFCACDCGGETIEIDSENFGWSCQSTVGAACGDGSEVFTDCVTIGHHKVCGP